jgi:tetratricopeptide (TPR) repeat protein
MKFALLALVLVGAPAIAAPMASDKSRYAACIAIAQAEPQRGIETAQAWRIEGGGIPARHCLALAQFTAKDYAAALASYEGAAIASDAAKDGQAVNLWSQGADAAMLAGKPHAAVHFLDKALAGDLSDRAQASIRVNRAEALVDLKRYPEASADLDKATRLDPKVRYGWLLQATLARRMGDFKLAEAAILKAAEQEADSADVQFEAGNIAAAQGKDALARAAWLAAARADPDSPAGLAANKALQGD